MVAFMFLAVLNSSGSSSKAEQATGSPADRISGRKAAEIEWFNEVYKMKDNYCVHNTRLVSAPKPKISSILRLVGKY